MQWHSFFPQIYVIHKAVLHFRRQANADQMMSHSHPCLMSHELLADSNDKLHHACILQNTLGAVFISVETVLQGATVELYRWRFALHVVIV